MAFLYEQKVLFKHCDPAGIVFYPRYFEMINDVVEEFFSAVLDMPFENIHQTGGVPTVEIQTRFHAPSRHGEFLKIILSPKRIGKSSLDLELIAMSEKELRFTCNVTLVNVDVDGKPTGWNDAVRSKVVELTPR